MEMFVIIHVSETEIANIQDNGPQSLLELTLRQLLVAPTTQQITMRQGCDRCSYAVDIEDHMIAHILECIIHATIDEREKRSAS